MTAAVETMAYVGEVPWHGLGVKVEPNITVDEMLKAAGLDWEVKKRQLYFRAGERLHKSSRWSLVRENDFEELGHVSETWEPCQNKDAFSVLEEFVDRGELEMHTAGSLCGGRVVWALAKMKPEFALFKEDRTEMNLLIVNPHEFGKVIHARATPIRVVCQNTLSLSLGMQTEVKASQDHRKAFDAAAMKKALGIATDKFEKYQEVAEFISTKQLEENAFKNFLRQVFPAQSSKGAELSRNAKKALEVFDTQPGAEYGKGTWWQGFNTVTYMVDHVIGRSPDTRIQSAWLGGGAEVKNKALELAVSYAKAA